VAEFLLAEVLDRQSEEVRRLLLRTSVLERVSGPLADVLTGGSGGERILQDLEQVGAFVLSLDAGQVVVPLSPAVCGSAAAGVGPDRAK
jgi:LuxR family maltose regulon positive regulatory protein